MAEIILKGHKVAKGKAAGEAVVSHAPMSFMSAVDSATGKVIEKNHPLEGISIAGKILVFPVEKGSTGGSGGLFELTSYNTQPIGIINLRADPIIAVGAIISNIPMVDRLDANPLEVIKTGDYVEIDADQGVVKVTRA